MKIYNKPIYQLLTDKYPNINLNYSPKKYNQHKFRNIIAVLTDGQDCSHIHNMEKIPNEKFIYYLKKSKKNNKINTNFWTNIENWIDFKNQLEPNHNIINNKYEYIMESYLHSIEYDCDIENREKTNKSILDSKLDLIINLLNYRIELSEYMPINQNELINLKDDCNTDDCDTDDYEEI